MEYLKEVYFDEPIKYKDLEIHPVLMKDIVDFNFAVNCLQVDKNSTPDVRIISMNYLKFLYFMSKEYNMPYLYMLNVLLHIVLHLDNTEEIRYYERDNRPYFSVKNIEYTADDFSKISDIIFLQNDIEKIDNTIQKEIRDALENAERYKQEQSGYKMCSVEDQMICLMVSTSLKLEDIYELTFRKFKKALNRVDAKMQYEINLKAALSGTEFKDKKALRHWMADLSKSDKYSDVKVDMDEMRNKIDNINK